MEGWKDGWVQLWSSHDCVSELAAVRDTEQQQLDFNLLETGSTQVNKRRDHNEPLIIKTLLNTAKLQHYTGFQNKEILFFLFLLVQIHPPYMDARHKSSSLHINFTHVTNQPLFLLFLLRFIFFTVNPIAHHLALLM